MHAHAHEKCSISMSPVYELSSRILVCCERSDKLREETGIRENAVNCFEAKDV